MKKSLATVLFLAASVNAYAVDGGAVLGGALGGAAGAAVGQSMGGQNGAILGAAIGGGAGAALGSRPAPQAVAQPVPVQQRENGDEEEHRKHNRHHGRED